MPKLWKPRLWQVPRPPTPPDAAQTMRIRGGDSLASQQRPALRAPTCRPQHGPRLWQSPAAALRPARPPQPQRRPPPSLFVILLAGRASASSFCPLVPSVCSVSLWPKICVSSVLPGRRSALWLKASPTQSNPVQPCVNAPISQDMTGIYRILHVIFK